MADPVQTPTGVARPESRYGRSRRGPSRTMITALTVLVLVLGVVVAVLGYQRLGTSEVKGELAAYRLVDDRTVEVTVTVTRPDPSQPVVCVIRARSRDGSETGRRELLVAPSDQTTVQVTGLVRTTRTAVVGDVYGCGVDVPEYLVPATGN